RVDLCLLPLLGALYAVCVVDRGNLGLARTAGMDHDLELSVGSRYSIVSCVYFIPYIILQLPSNLMLRRIGVTNWLAFCVTSWGAVQLGMGFVHTWGELAVCRMFLGALEAGFFPGLVFIITTWYTRHEVQQRLASFYIFSIVVGGFSAILAYLLALLDGKLGFPGWSWIFIVEGALTMAFGLLTWGVVPGFPDQNRFLTKEQTELVLTRVENDRGDSVPDEFTREKVFLHLSDWKIWAFGLMYFCATVPAQAIGFFLTNLLFGMGWSVRAALLLSAPPYLVAAVSIVAFAKISDRHCSRALPIAVQTVITIIGLMLIAFSRRPGWRYAGIFLSNAGSGGCIPGILAYSANNVVSHTKRAVATAVVISFGGIAGIFATNVFRQQDAPTYLPGIYITVGCQFLLLVLLAITTAYFWWKNRGQRQGISAQHLEQSPGFLYTL
ncbi:MFS general substrate transporter, partial [Coprinopsis marcescibilis]